MDTCLDEYNGALPALTPGAIANLVLAAYFGAVLAGLAWSQSSQPRENSNRKSYGVGASSIIGFMASIGFALTLPKIVVYAPLRAASDHGLLGEIGCQAASESVVVPIFPAMLAFFSLLMVAFNFARAHVRHTFARIIEKYVVPARADKASTYRAVVLPAFRGVWVPPLARMFGKSCMAVDPGATIELIAMDDYGGLLCQDPDPAWLQHNMTLEGVDTLVRPAWTDFRSLSVGSGSVDVVIMPMSRSMPYLAQTRESTKRQEERARALLREIYRVLKPGGSLVSMNITGRIGDWERLMADAGYVDVKTLPGNVWLSWMPGRVSVGQRPDEKSSPVANDGQEVHTPAQLVTDPARTSMRLTAKTDIAAAREWFPSDPIWRMRNLLTAVSCGLFVVGFAVLGAVFDRLRAPTFLPWSDSVANFFLSNLLTVPLCLYFLYLDLTATCADLHFGEHASSDHAVASRKAITSGSTAEPLLDEPSRGSPPHGATRHVIQRWWLETRAAILGLTAYSFISWIPGAIIDWVMMHELNMSTDKIRMADTLVSILIWFLAMHLGRCLYSCYQKRRDKQLEKEESTAPPAADGPSPV